MHGKLCLLVLAGLLSAASAAFPASTTGSALVTNCHACHGPMNWYQTSLFQGEPGLDAVLSTFNPEDADYWATFTLQVIGVDNSGGTGEIGPVAPGTPDDAEVRAWILPASQGFFRSVGVNYTGFEERIGQPWHDLYAPVERFTTEIQPEPLPKVYEPFQGGALPKTIHGSNVPRQTIATWNTAYGTIETICRADGSGYVRLFAEGLIPNMIYEMLVVGAYTDVPGRDLGGTNLWVGPFGGLPALVSADESGRGLLEARRFDKETMVRGDGDGVYSATFFRELHYCPHEQLDPIMFAGLFAHVDGMSYSIHPHGPFNPIPLAGAMQLCCTFGPKLFTNETVGQVPTIQDSLNGGGGGIALGVSANFAPDSFAGSG